MRTAADITTRPLQLSTLLEGIENGSIVLPDFQRAFEWQEGEILSLVATVMAGWPAGSLLLMRGQPEFFETRRFTGVTRRSESVDYVVLDGQQRLTALVRALRGVGSAARYGINLDAVHNDAEIADELEEAFATLPDAGASHKSSTRGLLVPLTALNSAPDYFEWVETVVGGLDEAARGSTRSRLRAAYKDFLGTVNHYTFPSVILEPDLPTAAVARIFERINKGGLELSTFDLLVARAYRPGWNLRERWNDARRNDDLIAAYLGKDGLPLVQSITVRGTDYDRGDIRRPALLRLNPDALREQWDATVDAYGVALRFLSSAGFRNPDFLPYKTLHVPLAALARDYDLDACRPLLEAWLWTRCFNREYDVASSTVAVSDYVLLRDVVSGARTAPSFEIDLTALWNATRRSQAALWRTFLSYLLRRQASDPFTGEVLVPSPTDTAGLLVDSIFSPADASEEAAPHLFVLTQYLRMRRPRGSSTDLWSLIAPPAPVLKPEGLRSQLLDRALSAPRDVEAAALERLGALREALQQDLPTVSVVDYVL